MPKGIKSNGPITAFTDTPGSAHAGSAPAAANGDDHYIYLIRKSGYRASGAPIYKIGKTTRAPHVRFNEYEKGAELLISVQVDDCHAREQELIAKFRTIFTPVPDGRECFCGDFKAMVLIIVNHCYRPRYSFGGSPSTPEEDLMDIDGPAVSRWLNTL